MMGRDQAVRSARYMANTLKKHTFSKHRFACETEGQVAHGTA